MAGFAEEDLSITLEDGHLVVRGKTVEDGETREFLHRGIAARQFQRSFVLAEHMEVTEASLERGLLHIDLLRQRPEPVIQRIKIGTKG